MKTRQIKTSEKVIFFDCHVKGERKEEKKTIDVFCACRDGLRNFSKIFVLLLEERLERHLGNVREGNILVSVHIEDAHLIEVATEVFVAHRAVGVSHRTQDIALQPSFAATATSPSPLGA